MTANNVDTHLALVLLFCLILIVVDWLAGVLVSLRNGTFDIHQMPRQLTTTVVPYMGALILLFITQIIVAVVLPDSLESKSISGTLYAAAATFAAPRVIDIITKLQALLSGGTPLTNSPAPTVVSGPGLTGTTNATTA